MYSIADDYGFIARHVETLADAIAIRAEWLSRGYKGIRIFNNITGELFVG